MSSCNHDNYSVSTYDCPDPSHGPECAITRCDNCNADIGQHISGQSNSNIGRQFKGIIGHSLLSDSLDNLTALRSIIKPHADKVFSDPLASDKEILSNPAVQAHNQLFFAHTHMEAALKEHDSGTGNGKKDAILSHMSLMNGLKAAANIPGIEEHYPNIIGYFQNINQNLTKLANLNEEEPLK